MYTVRFAQLEVGSAYRPVFYQSESVSDCVQVAINLHRVSNVPHNVSVHQECEELKIFREVLFLTTDIELDVPDTPYHGKA